MRTDPSRYHRAQDTLQRLVDKYLKIAGIEGKLLVVTPETLFGPCPQCEAARRRADLAIRNAWGEFTTPGKLYPAQRKGKPPVLRNGDPQPRDERGWFIPAREAT